MLGYIARRLLLMIPTLLGIMVINFAVIQFAPGGPVEQAIAQIQGDAVSIADRINRTSADNAVPTIQTHNTQSDITSRYRGTQGLDSDFIAQLEQQYGFDKPAMERFWIMMVNYVRFDFGESFFKNEPVVDLIIDRLPVSISLGLWSTLIAYFISIPLGIAKAVRNGSRFDTFSSGVLIVGNAIPGFLFAILLVILFAGGSFFDIFPSRGLYSDNFDTLSLWGKIGDYFWHMTLPIIAMTISSFTILTLFTKNAFIDEISKQYVLTARAKGLKEGKVLYGHVFRNAMLIIIAGFPSVLFSTLLSGSVLIETVFSLEGLGLLGLEAVLDRDFPIIFGTLFVFSLLGLIVGLLTDLTYMWVDPRIDFEARQV